MIGQWSKAVFDQVLVVCYLFLVGWESEKASAQKRKPGRHASTARRDAGPVFSQISARMKKLELEVL